MSHRFHETQLGYLLLFSSAISLLLNFERQSILYMYSGLGVLCIDRHAELQTDQL